MSTANTHFTTLSRVFCCGTCYDSVALIEQPGGDLTYECTNPTCGKAVSLNAPEGLALIEDVPLKLAMPRQRELCEVTR